MASSVVVVVADEGADDGEDGDRRGVADGDDECHYLAEVVVVVDVQSSAAEVDGFGVDAVDRPGRGECAGLQS